MAVVIGVCALGLRRRRPLSELFEQSFQRVIGASGRGRKLVAQFFQPDDERFDVPARPAHRFPGDRIRRVTVVFIADARAQGIEIGPYLFALALPIADRRVGMAALSAAVNRGFRLS
jgi:hypothetical protein